jgi:hypothetical protein
LTSAEVVHGLIFAVTPPSTSTTLAATFVAFTAFPCEP